VTPRNPRGIAAGLSVLALAAVAWALLRPRAAAPPRSAAPAGKTAGKTQELPRIGLARLDATPSGSGAGGSDIFRYGAPSTKVVLRSPPPPVAPNPNPAGGPLGPDGLDASPTPPPVPAMNVKYIGSVADKRGLKVAVLMTDRKEVLTGRPGDVVANRFKIVSIGLESVDVQDLGSDRVRRIPLRAN